MIILYFYNSSIKYTINYTFIYITYGQKIESNSDWYATKNKEVSENL